MRRLKFRGCEVQGAPVTSQRGIQPGFRWRMKSLWQDGKSSIHIVQEQWEHVEHLKVTRGEERVLRDAMRTAKGCW